MAHKLIFVQKMILKITPSVDYNQWLKRLDNQLNEPTNQSPKLLSQLYYKTLGTSVFYSLISLSVKIKKVFLNKWKMEVLFKHHITIVNIYSITVYCYFSTLIIIGTMVLVFLQMKYPFLCILLKFVQGLLREMGDNGTYYSIQYLIL